MILSINQPAYLPWLGYFDRINKSDIHIVLDNVQLERNTKTSFANRNKIRTHQGWSWLTVPAKKSHNPEEEKINQIVIDGHHWKKKHLNSIQQSYSKTQYFSEHREWINSLYGEQWGNLSSLLKESTYHLLKVLNITTPIVFSSDLDVKGIKSELILNYCREVGATEYLSGPFGRDYLDINEFEKANIVLDYHDYHHPVYEQYHGEFIPYMSVIDLIFNKGDESLNLLTNSE